MTRNEGAYLVSVAIPAMREGFTIDAYNGGRIKLNPDRECVRVFLQSLEREVLEEIKRADGLRQASYTGF